MWRSECLALIIITAIVTTWLTNEIRHNEAQCDPIPEFKVFVEAAVASECNYGFPELIYMEDNMLIEKEWEYPDRRTYNCCYGSLDYVDSYSGVLEKNNTCSELRSPLQVSSEFAYVQCSMNSVPVYEDFYFFLHNHPYRQYARRQEDPGAPSVIVLILGQASRHVFRQELPRTSAYLQRVLRGQEFRRLQGHVSAHKNLAHLIRGRQPDADAIWFDYARRGHATAYGDDCPDAGAKLTPPAVLLDRFYPLDFNWESFYAAGRAQIGNQACLGSRPAYARLLDYAAQYVNLRNDNNPRPLFGVFYIDAFRYDRGNLRRADERFLHFFRTITPHLGKDTAMMLVGDNVVAERAEGGNAKKAAAEAAAERRGGNYVKSPPLFYFLLPISYKIEYPDASLALEWNSKKMVTYGDIHSTLRDLIKDNRGSASSGYSLLEKIPPGRSCRSVGIDPGWCLCRNGQ